MSSKKQFGTYIKHISDVLQKNCNNALASKGLTMSQLTVLHLLYNTADNEMTLKELEKHLQVAQSTVVGIINRLQQKGFIESYSSAEDKRVKIVSMTDDGKKCFLESQSYAFESESYILSCLSETEQNTLNSLLEKISKNL